MWGKIFTVWFVLAVGCFVAVISEPERPARATVVAHDKPRSAISFRWTRNLIPDMAPLAGAIKAFPVPSLPASGEPEFVGPDAEVAIALADAKKYQGYYHFRYLTMGHLSPRQMDTCVTAVNHAINAVSRSRAVYPVTRISRTVLRVDFGLYGLTEQDHNEMEIAFARIARDDPFFHLTTEIQNYGQTQTVVIAQGFTEPAVEATLREVTQTPGFGAVVRADTFVVGALSPPAYYELAGIPATEAEWQAKLRIHANEIQDLVLAANLRDSGVTRKQRRLSWTQGPFGGYYKTCDSKKNDAIHDVFRRPLTIGGVKNLEFDASEVFAMARNGFWQTAVFDKNGKRLDVVDPEIAHDSVADLDGAGNDLIYPGYSCLRCHTESGLNSFTDDEQRILRPQHGDAKLRSYSKDLTDQIVAAYDEPRLQRQVLFDRGTHDLATSRACGATPATAVAAIASVVKWSLYDRITPEVAARQIGIAPQEIPLVIGRTQDENLQQLEEGQSIVQDAWAISYTEAATKAYGYRKTRSGSTQRPLAAPPGAVPKARY